MNIEIDRPRKKLTIISPLPPRRTGIAAYMVELLPHLADRYDVTVVVQSSTDIVECPGCHVMSAEDQGLALAFENSAIIYQLANNPDHEYVYRLCVRYPGIVVLHEFVLHHLIESLTLGRGRPENYFRILEREYGPSGRVLGRLRQVGYFCENQKFLMPLSRHVVRRAKSVIVHNEYCARRLGWPFDRHIMVCPHHLSPLAIEFGAGRTKEDARNALGLEQNRTLILSLGFVTRPKRADVVLRALGHLKSLGHDFVYLLVGQCSERRWIEDLISQFGLADNVRMVDYVEEEDFFQYIAACDIVVNLRFPSAGESSGTLTRAMGMGTACVVFDYGPMAEFPDDAVIKVKFVRDERLLAYRLAHRLEEHIVDPDARERLANRAREYVRSHCGIDKTLEVYDLAIMRMLDDGEEFRVIEDVEL
jgi:glycosyltransferase involved in cell wall biosynthesis